MQKGQNGSKAALTYWRKIFSLLLLAGLPAAAGSLWAQPAYRLHLLPLDADSARLAEEISFSDSFPDSLALVAGLADILRQLHSRAYLEASVDTLDCRDSVCLAILHLGSPYRWTALANGNIPEELLDQAGYRERLYRRRPFSFEELRRLQEELVASAGDRGYPFAEVWLDSIRIDNNEVAAFLFMDRRRLIRFDTLLITGDARIAPAYLEHYLGLYAGEPYRRDRLLESRDRLRELSFLRPSADPTVTFRGDHATVALPLEKRQASRFDFLIGVLPQSSTTGRMLITGHFEGELINQLGRGERLYARFEQLRPQTQELALAFAYPYALGLPLGADLDFSLHKRDTSFLDLSFVLGVSYLFTGNNYLKAYWDQRSSNLLGIDEQALLEAQSLPPDLDISTATFGLELFYQRLDYRFNPRRGWSTLLRGGAGIKRIRRNQRIESIGLGYLYDTLQLRSFQYRLAGGLAGYLPLFSRSTLKAAVNGAVLLSEEPVYRNEQFRLGGNRLLRGFDEEFFFATHYAVGTLEYRLLLDQNSYLYSFADLAYLLDRTPESDLTFYPYGFGAGITFQTKVGLFGVSLAFGAVAGEAPVDFARPKVHFGYVSLF